MISDDEQKVYDALGQLGIEFERHEHPPVYTVDEAARYWKEIPGVHCKNLFMKNQKGKTHYLVVMKDSKKVDFKAMAGVVGEKLSFASEQRLEKYLGLKTGAVSPFGLINDAGHEVKVVIDTDLKAAKKINFHPNVNTATVTVSFEDFEKFLSSCGNSVQYVRI